ncbi:KDGP aldolase [Oceanobacillus profundus]|uniref:Oxo-acid lyase n=1 Tax=Oceanobacillus profundus TaxID=372463 RepID=A0A417YBM1_9BACI|nr:KDGP aldolase [Oceanobacillus profundus]RHW29917.1 oxo-acid lyase [Oceanobacillus profundus]
MKEKLYDKFLFNFIARDAANAAAVMEAGSGYVIPGIVSDNYDSIDAATKKVIELKTITDMVSIGLGGGGKTANCRKVLDIAVASDPGHINQPFETAAYTKGFLDGKGTRKQLANALIQPTGEIGKIRLANSGSIIKVEQFIDIAASLGIESIKMMPIKGNQHLDELIYLTKVAAAKGIRGVEPAGGIDASNIKDIVMGVMAIDIEFFMPHIFGSTIDKITGETIPSKVNEIMEIMEGL